MFEFFATLIVLGLLAAAAIALAVVIFRIVAAILLAAAALAVAGGVLWIAFQILSFFAQNTQHLS